MLTFCYTRHFPRNGYFCPTVVIHLGLEESCMFLMVLLIKSYYFCHHSTREIYTDPCWPVIWHVMGHTAGNQFCLRQLMKIGDITQQLWTWIDNLGWVTVWNIEWCKTRINVSVKSCLLHTIVAILSFLFGWSGSWSRWLKNTWQPVHIRYWVSQVWICMVK